MGKYIDQLKSHTKWYIGFKTIAVFSLLCRAALRAAAFCKSLNISFALHKYTLLKRLTRLGIEILPILVLLLGGTLQAQTDINNTLKIGIISPIDGRSSEAGGAHRDGILLAFERLGPIRLGGRQLNIQFVSWDDKGDPQLASQLAEQQATEEHVVAILGPVNSASTLEVLNTLSDLDIALPVISSMSTASDLIQSGQRDPNFFRLIFDDSQRMASYATFIEEEKRGQDEQAYLFLYENDVYGRGLARSLRANFHTSNIINHTWCNAMSESCNSIELDEDCVATERDCSSSILDPNTYSLVQNGEYFTDSFIELLDREQPENIVILGTPEGALAFSLGLEVLDRRFNFFLAGITNELLNELPLGSVVIGEPLLDPERAPTAELHSEWHDILTEFEQTYGRDQADFISTAYEAGMVMHSALRSYLNDRTSLPPLDEIRIGLLNVMESQTFDALEPWRWIRFSDGSLDAPPIAPIYRVTRGHIREDPERIQDWVQISVFPQFGYLESPITAELTSNSINRATISLSRMNNGVAYLEDVRSVDFSAGQASVDFHVLRQGIYRIAMEDVAYAPAMAETRVAFSSTYVVSILVSLFAALLVVSHNVASVVVKIQRVSLGVIAGLVFTFASLYGTASIEWFPFPSFGDEPIINAMVTGALGGILGPHFLPEIFISIGTLLTFSIKRGRFNSQRTELARSEVNWDGPID